MFIKSRRVQKRFGIASIFIGLLIVALSIVSFFSSVTMQAIVNAIIGIWLIIYGVMIYSGKGVRTKDNNNE